MKKLIRIVLVALVSIQLGYAQDGFESSFEKENTLSANLGLTQVGDQTLVGIRIQPEFSFGKFGIGLDVPLQYDLTNKSLRTQEFTEGAGALRMIRYLRWGTKKKDAFYIKLGDMTGEQIGFGALVGNYSNAISFERRKVGISTDILIKKKVGIEAIYSDVNFDGTQKMLAVRPYYKPLGASGIPILKTLEVGATYVSDRDDFEETNGDGVVLESTTLAREGVNAFGFDMGVILLKNALLKLSADVQQSTLVKNDALAEEVAAAKLLDPTYGDYDTGSGFSAGIEAHFQFIANVFHLNARLERQWYGDNYTPQFFSFAYELNKDNRLRSLVGVEASEGIYGRLGSEILGTVKIEGELILPDNLGEDNPRKALLGINLQTKEMAGFKARGKYVKANLSDLGDSLKFDESSQANLLITKRLNKLMEVGVDYQWTFAQDSNGDFKPVNQVRPYVGFNFKF
ncbi:hypothetical protein N9901_01865 [Flavobacteriaceae bacterium]|nr:hypothetical protein [Flavobacteriaceae bacterium]